ncbi:hypothetical protein [Nocardioides sp. Soil805]|uniref:hypothetical protein n=1 Tax=Nocardioides sp. Soil805 TaxID=1736416 RepID=UPI0007034334|nr:hypothetical protein [Nocardioides sp. Soil805]KRF34205.1 hypothetical protein ASG94_15905 [Nocardioides sp. Soil805]
MTDQRTFLAELARQQASDADPTSQTIADALGWDFARASQLLERLENRELVKTTPSQARLGDTHLDHWVALTIEGRAAVAHNSLDEASDQTDTDLRLDRWNRVDLPVLRELARGAESDADVALVDDIAARLNLRPRDVIKSYDVLQRTGFVTATFTYDSGGEFFGIRLSERGLRETELWPTPDSALDRMIAALQAIADNTREDEDTRTRAQKVLESLRGAGREIGISVVTAALTGQIPGTQ